MRTTIMGLRICIGLLLCCLSAWSQTVGDVSGKPARVALMSDVHVTRGTKEEQRFHKGRLERTIAAINAERVDLVLIAGDLTENGTRVEFSDLRKLLKKIESPVWFVPGNHDLGGKVVTDKRTAKDVTYSRVEAYEWRLGPSWFIREHAGVRVIGLNASLLGSGLPHESKMWKMLEGELGSAAQRPTLLLMHYPPFTKKPDEPGGVYWNVEPTPRKRLLGLVQSGGVRAVLAGHLHTEAVKRHEGVLYVTAAPVAFGLPKGRQYRGWVLLTVPPQGEVRSEFRYQVD